VAGHADVFLLMTLIFLALAACGLLMKRPTASAEAGAGH
jgi:hypothetical protein